MSRIRIVGNRGAVSVKERGIFRRVFEDLCDVAGVCFVERSRKSVSEWAVENVVFDEPGHYGNYSLNGMEYLREPLDDFGRNGVTDIALVFGSQTGKTSLVMAGLCWALANRSVRVLWVMPSEENAVSFSRTRWKPMLLASLDESLLPRQLDKIPAALQMIGGSVVQFKGSHSPANLASNPCDWVICDEVDKFNEGGDKEADAVDLAEQRTKKKVLPKRIKTSTPTLDSGLIWQSFLKGSQERYYMPCPRCGEFVTFAWSEQICSLRKDGSEAFVFWDSSAKRDGKWDLDLVRASAHAVCPFCRGKILDSDKTKMIRNGEWRATNIHGVKGFRSYHLSSIYSTDIQNSFGNLAVKFLSKVKSAQGIQGFVTGDLAEPWLDQSAVDRTEIFVDMDTRWEDSEGICILSVDCQQNSPHFWWVVREWWSSGDSVLRGWGSCDSFSEIEDIQRSYGVRDHFVLVDSGYNASDVYSECVKHGVWDDRFVPRMHFGWMPTKGDKPGRYWYDKKTRQKLLFGMGEASLPHRLYRIPVLEFNASSCKDILQRMRLQKTKQRWAVTSVVGDVYWSQMNSEVKRQRFIGGSIVYVWELRSKRLANHLFDCEVMQIAGAMMVGALDDFKEVSSVLGESSQEK